MARTNKGFEPNLAELRATELARQGLRNRRIVVSAKDMRSMLYGKTENPMLAIYGAHLMIQGEEFDRPFLRSVVRKLRELVGDHPDVMALLLGVDPDADVGDFSVPPMLSSSWSIIVAATASRPELVPRGSLSAAISERVLAGGPWLRWHPASDAKLAEAAEVPEEVLDLGEAIATLAGAPSNLLAVTSASDVSLAESEVISFAAQAGAGASQASDTYVLERLGFPRSVAEDAIHSVMQRIGCENSLST
jgi:hypothetical protein